MDALVTVRILDGDRLIKTMIADFQVPPDIVPIINERPLLASEYLCRVAIGKLKPEE